MTTKKEDFVCALRILADAIEKSREITSFNFNTTHETREVPTRYLAARQLTGWINIDFNIRFLKG
jgi:hypothetical protein